MTKSTCFAAGDGSWERIGAAEAEKHKTENRTPNLQCATGPTVWRWMLEVGCWVFPSIAISMKLVWIEVRAMHGRVTAGAPTAPESQKSRMILAANKNSSLTRRRTCRLGVTLQAQVVVALDEHGLVDRAVRIMADGAALAQRLVLEDEPLGLFAMTLRTRFVEPRHGKTAGGFQDIPAVRVVALHTIHFAFDDRMMLRQVELRVRLEMTLKTSRRVLAGIEDEFSAPAAAGDVFAAGAVAGFATVLTLPGQTVEAQARVRTGEKTARVVGVTFETGAIAGERCAFDGRR